LYLGGQPELENESGWETLRTALDGHDWVVYANRPFAEPQYLLRDLGRYVNRIAIANPRIESIDGGVIAFTYRDNREKEEKIEKTLHLSAEAFLRRFLSHILPPQFRRIRYSGFLVNSQRKEKLTACRALLGWVDLQLPYIADLEAFLERQGIDYSLCPSCGDGKMRCLYTVLPFHDPPQCYLAAA
jgi:hypothetical protein